MQSKPSQQYSGAQPVECAPRETLFAITDNTSKNLEAMNETASAILRTLRGSQPEGNALCSEKCDRSVLGDARHIREGLQDLSYKLNEIMSLLC